MSDPRVALYACFAALAFLACGERGAAEQGGAPAPQAAKPAGLAGNQAPAAPAGPSVVHVVREGETLWDIARAYGVSVEAIQQASGLRDRQTRRLSKGTQLRIPGATQVVDVLAKKAEQAKAEVLPPISDGAYHRLAAGESLWTVARSYDVPIEALLKRNKLSGDAMGTLRIGQAIIVPGISQSQVKAAEPSKPPKGFSHEVQPGETIWDLAHSFGVAVSEIMAANGLNEDEATNIRDGKRLFIPGVEDTGHGRVRRKVSASERRSLAIAERLGLGSVRAAGALLHGRVEARWIRAADGVGRFPGTLLWPVHSGSYVRGYGSGQGGYHKAMDIMGKMGWNVRAAAPGIVGYAGDQISGFGNMVMLVHPGGWVTLYAHNSVNFVSAGQRVNRGDILAEVGSTGRSMGPHVHFELIQGNNNCDPAPLLRPGVRRRDGKLQRVERATWTRPDRRPKQVRCAKRQKHPIALSVENEDPGQDITPEAQQGPTMEAPAEEEDVP
ncbi:MAG TPA: LysM peptidoglycan-binding domain-containing M23 family metallopeptidase [Polyangiales bacterium]|nr:LysM peptidoglycan-binding domain-containing M23 family metallopeptidase [Polyangiales bacterium]